MTLQTAMIGSDGIVLASDTWCYRNPLPQFREPGAVWDGYHRSKIKISDSRKIAISSAVNMEVADNVAAHLLRDLEGLDPYLRESIIQRTVGAIDPQEEFECIAAFLDPTPALFSIQYPRSQGQMHLTVTPMLAYCNAGDQMNPAVFWAMHYHRSTLPMAALSRLAAHMLVMASVQSSGNIRGLEILVSQNDVFHRVPEAECEQIAEDAKKNAAKIGDIAMKRRGTSRKHLN